ncbi:MAG: hypothetical protein ACKOEM_21770, partial [Planctomycetia bacterium]
MTMQFAFGEPSFDGPADASPAERLRSHAALVMADLAGATEQTLDRLPEELPVEAAVACGHCRLYGGAAPQAVFPAWLATAAARRLVKLLSQATEDTKRLPELWDDSTGEEAEDLVAGLLHARMDSWAALLQLDDVLEHCSDTADRANLEKAFEEFEAALDDFDRALFTRQDYLATLTGTHLLDNFRSMLAAEYRDPLPWWLDGRVEAMSAEVDAATDRLLDETLFDRAAVMHAWRPPTLADLRRQFAFAYVAAAATDAAAASPMAGEAVFRWASPGGDGFAEIVPPPPQDTASPKLIIDFADAAGAPLLGLVGTPCTLVGVPAVIERRDVVGEPRAAAVFSALAIFEAGART